MVPSGNSTEETVQQLLTILDNNDIVTDRGNSKFPEDAHWAAELQEHGIHYIDAGTSGGIWGLQIRLLPDGGRGKRTRESISP